MFTVQVKELIMYFEMYGNIMKNIHTDFWV